MNRFNPSGEIYTKEYYDKIFEEIEQIPLDLSPEEINIEIQKRINLTTIQGQTLSKDFLDAVELYRVRVPNPVKKSKEDLVSWHSYPPDPKYVTNKGRANIEGQQVFYASFDANTPFHEMSKYITPGSSIVYLSKWKINHPGGAFMRNLFLDIPTDDENNLSSLMAKGLVKAFDEIMIGVPENEKQNYIYSQKKYANLFAWPDEKYYHLTSSIAYFNFVSALKQKANLPILAYPSVAKNKKTVNWAIRKDFKDEYIHLQEVYKVLVNELTEDKVNVSIISKGVEEEVGKIKWLSLKQNVSFSLLYVSPDLNIKNRREVKPDDLFTACCNKHAINKEQLFINLNINEKTILKNINQIPINYNFEGSNVSDIMLFIPTNSKLYLNHDISENGQINYLLISVRYSTSFIAPD